MDWFSWENLNTGNHQFPMKIMVFSISVAICQLINSDVFFWFRGSHQHQLLYTESDLHFHFMLYVETQCVTIRTNPVTQYFSIDTMRTACSILRANFLKIFPPVWWFQTFFYFPFHIWVVILPLTNSYFSTWLKHVKTTNQPSFSLFSPACVGSVLAELEKTQEQQIVAWRKNAVRQFNRILRSWLGSL